MVPLRNFTKVVCMQRARADRGNAPVGGTGRNFCFGFLSYMWRSSVDRDRSRSCLGAGGAAVRWRALFLWQTRRHGHVVVVHQDAVLPVFVMVALVRVVEGLSDVVLIRRAHHALFDVRREDFAIVPTENVADSRFVY